MFTNRFTMRLGLPLLIFVLALMLVLEPPPARAADPEDRVLDILNTATENTGTTGVYLKQVGGPVIAANNENFVFEPASTIKALIHFHAMRAVQDGAIIDGDVVTLNTQVPWFMNQTGSCPDLTNEGSDTLQNGLSAMMGPSDNRWTQALRDFFDDSNINATRQTFDMNNTVLTHLIGCFVSEPPAGSGFIRGIEDRNQLTLVDAGKMYEAVATGFLDNRALAYSLMTNNNATFNGIIDAEAVGLGLSLISINDFKAQRQSANKAGSYGGDGKFWRSVAGWGQIPWKDSVTCAINVREYVYGVFIDEADMLDAGFMGASAAGAELFREEIRAALESWAECEADLWLKTLEYVDPPAEMDVNFWTPLDVRATIQNLGPASDVAAEVTISPTSVPSDCQVSPSEHKQQLAAPLGVDVAVEKVFQVTCSDPSTHSFTFGAEVWPVNPLFVETFPSNNNNTTGGVQIDVIAYADLAILGWDFAELDAAGIQDLLVGQDFLFSTTKTLHNFGDAVLDLYHDPVDAIVSKSLEVPEGVRGIVTVGVEEAPANITIQRPGEVDEVLVDQPAGTVVEADGPATLIVEFGIAALQIGVDRAISEEFGLRCLAPGEHQIAFRNSIEPEDEHVRDPDPDNDTAEVDRTVECVTPVQINIRPGNSHNFVNPQSRQTLPVAILTTEEGEYGLPLAFDATAVDHTTARFGTAETLNLGGGSTAAPDKDFIRDSFEMDDKTRDGDLDMVLLLGVPDSGIVNGTVEACVAGSYLGADANVYKFFGCDAVTTQP